MKRCFVYTPGHGQKTGFRGVRQKFVGGKRHHDRGSKRRSTPVCGGYSAPGGQWLPQAVWLGSPGFPLRPSQHEAPTCRGAMLENLLHREEPRVLTIIRTKIEEAHELEAQILRPTAFTDLAMAPCCRLGISPWLFPPSGPVAAADARIRYDSCLKNGNGNQVK
jgi:hypothetical protein